MFPKDTTATNSSKSFKFGENQKEKTRMEHRVIPCAEGDDKFIADHLIKIGFFQHERIIHLIVTAVYAIIDLLAFFCL